MTKVIIKYIIFLALTLNLSADSSYDRTLEVLDTTRDQKVKEVFKELISAYQDEDTNRFLENVSEDRFIQDYITFTDAIYEDFRLYDILEIEYWFDEIVPKGVKRYLTVRWQRHSESLTNSNRYTKTGKSKFLFDEIDGKYYLIEIAGNNLWGDSVEEWREEVTQIAGQEPEIIQSGDGRELKPDLIVSNFTVLNFDMENIGTADTQNSISWTVHCLGSLEDNGTYSGGLDAGDTTTIAFNASSCPAALTIVIDTNDDVDELREDNNEN